MNNIFKISFSTAFLKHVAIITMLIDHIGYAFFPNNFEFRLIGRSSLVIFCYLIAEGLYHTSSRLKYFLRLFIFAIISFVPFSLFGFNTWFYTYNLNIFFVLSFSVLMIMLVDYSKRYKFSALFQFLIVILFSFIGIIFHFDYAFLGFLLISIFYLFRDKKLLEFILFFISTLLFYPLFYYFHEKESLIISIITGIIEFCGIISLFFIFNSNRNFGNQLPKFFYYSFYPIHLLLIWIIKLLFY